MTKVLVVDDSALMRKHLSSLFKQAGLEVLSATNGQDAVEKVLSDGPDVITLDINMPDMDGLTALSQIMIARPTPVVMVSSLTTKGALSTLEALAMGAVDFIAKPGGTISLSIDDVAEELLEKVIAASRARTKAARAPAQGPGSAAAKVAAKPAARPFARREDPPAARSDRRPVTDRFRRAAPEAEDADDAPIGRPASGSATSVPGLVLIGVSTGGPRTLEEILPLLPADLPWPVVVAQHMPAAFTAPLASRLDGICALRVREAAQLEPLRPGNVYIAKGGTDLCVSNRGGQIISVNRPESPKYHWHPSVELLVRSAMEVFSGDRLIAVQLTGMGNDGARAMAQLKLRGGHTVAESEDSAVVFGMPKELIALGGASVVLPAPKIAEQITDWLR